MSGVFNVDDIFIDVNFIIFGKNHWFKDYYIDIIDHSKNNLTGVYNRNIRRDIKINRSY